MISPSPQVDFSHSRNLLHVHHPLSSAMLYLAPTAHSAGGRRPCSTATRWCSCGARRLNRKQRLHHIIINVDKFDKIPELGVSFDVNCEITRKRAPTSRPPLRCPRADRRGPGETRSASGTTSRTVSEDVCHVKSVHLLIFVFLLNTCMLPLYLSKNCLRLWLSLLNIMRNDLYFSR